MHRLMGRSKWQRLQWIVGDLFLILYFLTDNVPPLRLLKALKWAGEVSGERRWKIGAVSPPNLWLDLAEVRFPLFAKWARPGFSAEAIKSHFAPPVCSPLPVRCSPPGRRRRRNVCSCVTSRHVGLHHLAAIRLWIGLDESSSVVLSSAALRQA